MSSSRPKKPLYQDEQTIRQISKLLELYPQYMSSFVREASFALDDETGVDWLLSVAGTIEMAGDPEGFGVGRRPDGSLTFRAL